MNELPGCSLCTRQAHPWFEGVQWDKLYQMEAAFIPEVNDDLDTQNFEKFDESANLAQAPSKTGPWRKMLSSKDINFVGYTYKNFEIVNDHQGPGIAELKKTNNKPKLPSIKTLFEDEGKVTQPSQGSVIDHFPPKDACENQSSPE